MKYAVLIACFALIGSAGGWAGQEILGPVGMVLTLVLGFATAGLFAYQRPPEALAARSLLLVPVWGTLLALGLFVAGGLLYGANDVLINSNIRPGQNHMAEKSLLGIGLGVALGLIIAIHVRRPRHRWARIVRLLIVTAWLGVAITAIVLLVVRTGVREAELYPPPDQSPYKLPWPGGMTWLCSQGNWGIITHRTHERYHFDFPMPIGSPICAARDGIVSVVIDQHDGNTNPLLHAITGAVPWNCVHIKHADGTTAIYGHIAHGSARVTVGQRVKQGDLIAACGNVGFSTSPHLHFGVVGFDHQSMPISFRDVPYLRGIPRAGLRYTSGNKPLP